MGLFTSCFYMSSIGTFQVFYITLLGISFKKLKFVDEKFESSLSKMLANMMLPSFIFCEVLLNFDNNNLYQLSQTVFGLFTVFFLSIIVGYIFGILFKFERGEKNILMAVLSSNNSTSIALILIYVLEPNLYSMKFVSPSQSGVTKPTDRGRLYISLMSIVSNLWRWSVTYNLINENPQTDLTQALIEKNNKFSEDIKGLNKQKKQNKSYVELLKEMINIPISVAIITLIFSFNNFIKNIFTSPTSMIKLTLFDAHLTVSKCYSFCVLFMLGLNISNVICGKEGGKSEASNNIHTLDQEKNLQPFQNAKSRINYYNIFLAAILKLVIIPLLGSPIIIYYWKNNYIFDPVLVYLLLFSLAAPTAINVMLICNMKKAWEDYVAIYMLVSYTICLVTITISNTVFIYILSP
jgi:predicted permease